MGKIDGKVSIADELSMIHGFVWSARELRQRMEDTENAALAYSVEYLENEAITHLEDLRDAVMALPKV